MNLKTFDRLYYSKSHTFKSPMSFLFLDQFLRCMSARFFCKHFIYLFIFFFCRICSEKHILANINLNNKDVNKKKITVSLLFITSFRMYKIAHDEKTNLFSQFLMRIR